MTGGAAELQLGLAPDEENYKTMSSCNDSAQHC